MLESQLGLFVDQASGHYQVAGNPLGALVFQGLDLVLRSAVKLLARDILIDFRGTFAVRAVGAAKITRIGYTDRAVFRTVPAELPGAGITAVETAGGTVLAVTKRLAVVATGEPTTLTVTFAARTVTVGLVVTVTIGFTFAAAKAATLTVTLAARTITKRLVVTVTVGFTFAAAERFPVSAAEAATLAIALAARTVTKRLVVTVTIGFTFAAAKAATLTVTLAARTITERLVVTVTVRLPLTTAAACERFPFSAAGEWLALSSTEGPTLAITFAARTITKRLTFAGTRRALRSVWVTVFAGTESARVAARIVVAAERTAVLAAAVAAVVLSHGDSSCYEPTTGAIAAARSVFRYPTQPEIKRFEVRTSQSILGETPPTDDMDPSPDRLRGNVHTPRRTLSHVLRVSGGRSRSSCVFGP
ncbi:hypothetical protein NFC73_10305 [Pseudarthrobacter sp. RMG13]|uniref:Uncharacterized protein n=1 Tax=Pseudarthrobacter humi TaxID=2952523 RepID=A0ABT1LQG9_9MICC|nr:hypothetical protein [Pseudarthrobacter humi]MCP9000119.1 hypothetical protein [Pseudarthrobacter humi]